MAKEEAKKELVKSEESRSLMPFGDIGWNRWFDDFFRRPFVPFAFPRLSVAATEIIPYVDIFEDNGVMVLRAELPGIKKEDLEVTLTDCCITISGEKKQEEEIKRKDYYKWERSYGSFCRSFDLPAEVQVDKVKSTFKDGVLEVRVPKSEAAKSKEVKVNVE